jgi:putative membrane protein
MSHSPSSKPTGLTNELAKERNRAASERTMTAWIQNSLTLIGLGVAFDRVYGAVVRTFPNVNPTISREFATYFGLGAIATGLFLLLLVAIEYPLKLKAIERDDYLYVSATPSLIIIVAAIFIFGFFGFIFVLLNLGS